MILAGRAHHNVRKSSQTEYHQVPTHPKVHRREGKTIYRACSWSVMDSALFGSAGFATISSSSLIASRGAVAASCSACFRSVDMLAQRPHQGGKEITDPDYASIRPPFSAPHTRSARTTPFSASQQQYARPWLNCARYRNILTNLHQLIRSNPRKCLVCVCVCVRVYVRVLRPADGALAKVT